MPRSLGWRIPIVGVVVYLGLGGVEGRVANRALWHRRLWPQSAVSSGDSACVVAVDGADKPHLGHLERGVGVCVGMGARKEGGCHDWLCWFSVVYLVATGDVGESPLVVPVLSMVVDLMLASIARPLGWGRYRARVCGNS